MNKGGLSVLENLQILCRTCNGKKGRSIGRGILMKDLLYTALDVACIIDNAGLSTREAINLAHRMHTEDKFFLAMEYRQNYRKWLLDILYWSDYMQDKITLDAEFPSVQAVSDGTLDVSALMRDDFVIDLFFKKLRVQILYFGKKIMSA